jgi:hypothetical protein
MNTETSRQAYIRLLRLRAETLDSLTEQQRDVVLVAELINEEFVDGSIITNGDGFPVRCATLGMKPKGRLFLKQLEKEETDLELTRKYLEDFKTLDRRELFRMPDKMLAEWQIKYRTEDPQWKLAEYEWQRRLTFEQIRTSLNVGKQSAVFAVIASIAGSIVGAILTLVVQELSRK